MPPSKPPTKPNKRQIEMLKARPDLAAEFGRGAAAAHLRRQYGRSAPAPHRRHDIDQLMAKHGAGAAQVHLLAELIDKMDELIDHVTAPKRVIKDAKGEIVGAEIED